MKIVLNLAPPGSPWLKPSKVLALCIKSSLESLILCNRLYLRLHKVPCLYESGIRYEEEPPGQGYEDFASIPIILSRGWGDCDDIVSWRIAELRNAGENAKIRLKWEYDPRNKARMYHVLVRRENGQVEDPSLRLGMGTHVGARRILTP